MQLSLSVRIAEEFLSKEKASMPLTELASLAKRCGYEALCMRASQVGVHSAPEEVERAVECLADSGLAVSMITGDFDTVYNNENGPSALRNISPYLHLAKRMGVTRAVNVVQEKLADVQAELGMDEGFDVGLEMSGNPNAFNDMLENMCHGGKIAMLGIPEKEMAIDWNKVVFNMLTIKGIYGREMYETWYKMTVMLEGGLDIAPVITHRFGFEEFEKGFETALSGESGKVILKW